MSIKSKHYTSAEKNLFVQIPGQHKNIIECKKSNSTTLRKKNTVWTQIASEFNNSSIIMQENNILEKEDNFKIERLKAIIKHKQQIANIKLKHEEKLVAIKEAHLIKINELELRTALAKAELAELFLKKGNLD